MDQAPKHARLLVFHGGKPGEGKSLLAHNLAVSLAERGQRRVLLLDLDSSGAGEIPVRCNVPSGATVADLVGNLHRLDTQTLRGFFAKTPSGVEVARLAPSPQAAMDMAPSQFLRLLQVLRTGYNYILCDGVQGWDELTLALLDAADGVALVCSPDIVSVKHARLASLKYQELKFPLAKIGIVLNRCSVAEALPVADVEKTLPGHRVLGWVPLDAHATEAVNHQAELITLFPHSEFAKSIRSLAQVVQSMEVPNAAAAQRTGTDSGETRPTVETLDRTALKERIHRQLLDNPELKDLAGETTRTAAAQALLRERVEQVVTGLMAVEAPSLVQREARETLVREVVDEALGLGPLEDLMRDPEVTEIMVNGRERVYVEQKGKLMPTDKHFVSEKQLRTVMERIVAPLGRRLDESQPYVDARLSDGSRVNAIIPPLALNGPTLTIRKFSRQALSMQDLEGVCSLSAEMAAFLRACVMARRNIVISGGTGSGKTTFLNILSSFIAPDERIITVEDASELKLSQPHVVSLEARPANLEGKGAVSIRDLIRNCLRMRPDRIVVGECRGGETLDMLQAMNTGHDGSLTTVHANSPKDLLSRLETLVLMSGMDLPLRAIREQIAGGVDVIVQQARLQDGTRKVTQITEVAGIVDGAIAIHDVFQFKQIGVDAQGKVQGVFEATGYMPTCLAEFAQRGITFDPQGFSTGRKA